MKRVRVRTVRVAEAAGADTVVVAAAEAAAVDAGAVADTVAAAVVAATGIESTDGARGFSISALRCSTSRSGRHESA
jgi:hypothetical protein